MGGCGHSDVEIDLTVLMSDHPVCYVDVGSKHSGRNTSEHTFTDLVGTGGESLVVCIHVFPRDHFQNTARGTHSLCHGETIQMTCHWLKPPQTRRLTHHYAGVVRLCHWTVAIVTHQMHIQ